MPQKHCGSGLVVKNEPSAPSLPENASDEVNATTLWSYDPTMGFAPLQLQRFTNNSRPTPEGRDPYSQVGPVNPSTQTQVPSGLQEKPASKKYTKPSPSKPSTPKEVTPLVLLVPAIAPTSTPARR